VIAVFFSGTNLLFPFILMTYKNAVAGQLSDNLLENTKNDPR